MNTFRIILAALFSLLTLSTAQPPGTVATQCTVQVFATGMHNKGIIVSTYIPFPWTYYLKPAKHKAYADFGSEKASVDLLLPIQGTQLQNHDILIQFTANYYCNFDYVRLSNVNSGGVGTGECFEISQQCSSLPYGTVYIDMWCNVPSNANYPSGVIKMNYDSQGPQVPC